MPQAAPGDQVIAAALYNDASRDLVLGLKRGRKLALAPMNVRLMAARLDKIDCDWVLVPVPLHRWRLWQRGFNQSALLAQEIARINGSAVLLDGLIRRKSTRSLGGLGPRPGARSLPEQLSSTARWRRGLQAQSCFLSMMC